MGSKWNDTRPLSPHLQVWRWHPTMLSSILHRATGVALYLAIILLSVFLAVLAAGPEVFMNYSAIFYSPLGAIGFFIVIGILSFHMLNGIRHLIWDSGHLLSPPVANAMSIAIIAAAAVIAVILTFILVSSVGGV
ncbi:succinate dehydrogenase, cytochrome b556 subunit [Robiginitomaculum antarcticum]|uniref:succinate dehydrogenase, cytochrome b556 subunit n=1 Tax=Robiginitomaculum antarcticum TaxID=437507 RepID=UPI000374E524|nr:succinate dehydrogenase, cytochrome b556 subunit [Robiginitomaculum antarcticum]